MIIILTEADEQAVLDRLLSSTRHVCSCQQAAPVVPVVEPPAPEVGEDLPTWSGQPWSAAEVVAISDCASPLQARKAYRRAFPESDRTNDAIKARHLALKKAEAQESDAIAADLRDECSAEQQEVETEIFGEPAGPVDSEIAAEMEGQGLDRLDPTLAGLRDEEEVPPPAEAEASSKGIYGDHAAYEADLMDGALCDAPLSSPEPEKKPRTRKDAWTHHEDVAIFDAANAVEAVSMYLTRVPEGHRTELAIKSRWKYLKKTGWRPEGEKGDDQPLPLHTRVRLLLQGSKYCGCEAEIVRQTGNPDEYVVVPDGAVARFLVTRKDLEVLS